MGKSLFSKIFTAIKNDNLADAASGIDKLIKKDPDNPNHYVKKGDICQKLSYNQKAVAAYQKAAYLFKNQGFLKKALAIYKIILRIDPENKIAKSNAEEAMSELYSIEEQSIQPASYLADIQQEEEVRAIPAETEIKVVGEEAATDLLDISHNPFFLPFNSEEIMEIFNRAKIKSFANGETVIREGDSGDSIYVINEGTAKVVSSILGRNIVLATLKAGDIFGEVAFLTGRPRTASVITEGKLVVYELDRTLLEDMLARKPEIIEYLNEIYHLRTKETENKAKNQ